MTSLPFYTDALAAAWMTKHFGMRFQFLGEYGLADYEVPITGDDCWRAGADGRFYIHSASLHLLDAQDSDAVVFDRWHWDRQRFDDMKDALPQPHYATVRIDGDWKHIFSAGIGWDRVRVGERFALAFKIIQRDGKAFMWPESDAA